MPYVAVTIKLLQQIDNDIIQEQTKLGRKLTKEEKRVIIERYGITEAQLVNGGSNNCVLR